MLLIVGGAPIPRRQSPAIRPPGQSIWLRRDSQPRFDVGGWATAKALPGFSRSRPGHSAALDAFSAWRPGTSFVYTGTLRRCVGGAHVLGAFPRPAVIDEHINPLGSLPSDPGADPDSSLLRCGACLTGPFEASAARSISSVQQANSARKLPRRPAQGAQHRYARDLDYRDRMALAWRHFWRAATPDLERPGRCSQANSLLLRKKNWAGLIDAENVTRRDYPWKPITLSRRGETATQLRRRRWVVARW